MKLKCECGKEWDYSGDNKVFATCPDCRKLVRVPPSQGGFSLDPNSGNIPSPRVD